MLARLPLDISDADVHELAVEEGWNDDFLRGGPQRPLAAPVSGNIRNAFANGVPPKLPPVPRGAVVASPAPVPKAAVAVSPGGVPVAAATPEPAVSIPAAPTLAPPPPVSGAALLSPVPEATTVSKAAAPAPSAAAAPAPSAAADPAPSAGADTGAIVGIAANPESDPPICVICQASMAPGTGEVRVLDCSHCYHAQCMDEWFAATSNYTVRCPLRCDLSAHQHDADQAAVAADVQIIEATSFV